MPSEVWTIERTSPEFPARLARDDRWQAIRGIGDRSILQLPCVGLTCSVQCPGSIVIKALDAIRDLRDAGVVVAGGFHSPMEQECLGFLLRGKQPVIVCPARYPSGHRLPADWRTALDDGRLLILSPFEEAVRRPTTASATTRNEFVASLSRVLLVPHASPGGKAEQIAQNVLRRGETVLTFDETGNEALFALEASLYSLDSLKEASLMGVHHTQSRQRLA